MKMFMLTADGQEIPQEGARKVEIIGKDEADILAYAMRYAMPRYTGAPSTVAEKLAKIYKQLSDSDLYLFIRDIDDGLYLAHPVHRVNYYARNEYRELSCKMKAELRKRLGGDKFAGWMSEMERERSCFTLREQCNPQDLDKVVSVLAGGIRDAARDLGIKGIDAEELARIVRVRVSNDLKREKADATD